MCANNLKLNLTTLQGETELDFTVKRLVCAGWVGRDEQALLAHIKELEEIGIPAPSKTPIHMNFATHLVAMADSIDVISVESSGEVEYVVFRQDGCTSIGVGSDHTDRGFEKFSIPASKHMYTKVIAPQVWPLEELQAHWDRIELRSWVTRDGDRMLYQEGSLASILDVDAIVGSMPKDDGLGMDGLVMFSGTVASKMGMVYGESFDFEIKDPVLSRGIAHGYSIRVLPQYL
ncbi:MAG: DUF2848 family protein [SAR324 cluster bacterium]|nr:DUF2848 family protein [SAR324 cluster bacterium]